MSWVPNDLVTDFDLRDYEGDILSKFGTSTWQGKRTKALEDWLFPILRAHGFDPYRLRTRYECDQVFGYTGSVYSDVTPATKDTTADDLNLATIFASASTDALYLGSTQPFRGFFVQMKDSTTAVAGVLSVAYWNGGWTNLLVDDDTSHTDGTAFSGGGAVTFLLPVDWVRRSLNSSSQYYWAKVTVSATPTSAKAGQLGVIRSSALRAPATLRTLQMIFQEAPTRSDGPWREKAQFYKEEADVAMQRAIELVGGEFDSDDSDQISTVEAAQTSDQVGNTGWSLERA